MDERTKLRLKYGLVVVSLLSLFIILGLIIWTIVDLSGQLKDKENSEMEMEIFTCKVLNKLSLSSLSRCCVNFIDLKCNGQKKLIKNCTLYDDLKTFNQHCTKF